MSKTLYDVSVRDNLSIRNFSRLANDIEEVKRAFKSYEIIDIKARKVINFNSKIIEGSNIRD